MNELRISRSMSLATGLSAPAQHSPEPTPEQRSPATHVSERALRDDPALDLMQLQLLMVTYPVFHCWRLPARPSTERVQALDGFMGYAHANCFDDKEWVTEPKGDVVVHAQA